MGIASDIARAILAVVFTVAAVAKLLDLNGTQRTMVAFGLPPRLASRAGTLLPFAELVTALALVVTPSARWGGLAALVLLALFIGGIVNVLAQGRTPNCNCFGQIASSPVSWRTLVRNGALAALAVIVVARGAGSSLLAFSGTRSASELIAVLLALLLVGLAMVVVHLRRENKTLDGDLLRLRRQVGLLPGGLPVGLRAPMFELPDVRGGSVSLSSLCALGKPVALVFTSPDCGPCTRLLPELARWHAALSDQITFAVVSNGGPEQELIAQELRAAGDFVSVVQAEQEIADFYRVMATPAAVIVNPDGRIASASAGGPDEIEALVRLTIRRAQQGQFDTELAGQLA